MKACRRRRRRRGREGGYRESSEKCSASELTYVDSDGEKVTDSEAQSVKCEKASTDLGGDRKEEEEARRRREGCQPAYPSIPSLPPALSPNLQAGFPEADEEKPPLT